MRIISGDFCGELLANFVKGIHLLFDLELGYRMRQSPKKAMNGHTNE